MILRSTLPQHFVGNDGYCSRGEKNTQSNGCANRTTHLEHLSNHYLKSTAEQYGFKYMDSFPFHMDRWDLHYKQGDCTHTCTTAETTAPELALLNGQCVELIRTLQSTDHSHNKCHHCSCQRKPVYHCFPLPPPQKYSILAVFVARWHHQSQHHHL